MPVCAPLGRRASRRELRPTTRRALRRLERPPPPLRRPASLPGRGMPAPGPPAFSARAGPARSPTQVWDGMWYVIMQSRIPVCDKYLSSLQCCWCWMGNAHHICHPGVRWYALASAVMPPSVPLCIAAGSCRGPLQVVQFAVQHSLFACAGPQSSPSDGIIGRMRG